MNRHKKGNKYRGSKTHGGGSMKKRRGAGHRGGRGNAGSGKRGDSKKPSVWGTYPYRGKKGFTPKQPVLVRTINVYELEKLAKTQGKTVDLTALGYDKLLGAGSLHVDVKVTVGTATDLAVEKVKKAKGTITLTAKALPAKASQKTTKETVVEETEDD